MYWLKACPRCHGDLMEVRDIEEPYVSCIQCGKVLTAAQEKSLPRPPRQPDTRAARRSREAAA